MKTSIQLLLALCVAGGAAAAGASPASEALATYQRERAVCLSGQSNQDRATCLKEAGAAYGEAKRANLGTQGGRQIAQNRLVRCDAVPAADRDDCVRRANGEGTTSGSALQGGILRESTSPVAPRK